MARQDGGIVLSASFQDRRDQQFCLFKTGDNLIYKLHVKIIIDQVGLFDVISSKVNILFLKLTTTSRTITFTSIGKKLRKFSSDGSFVSQTANIAGGCIFYSQAWTASIFKSQSLFF